MDKPESTSNEDVMGNEIDKVITKLNESYREAQLPQIKDNLASKSNVFAEAFRENGDEHLATGSFEDARRSYTLCLAYAEEDSEAIGHSYANRSAALYQLNFFEQSLLDIDRALNSNYPEDKKKGLHERKEQASKKAEQSPALASSRTSEVETEWRDKVRDFRNLHIPGASNKIKLERNEKWGRHLTATENINAGEILTCQKFFTMVRHDGSDIKYKVCSYCLLYHPALIPCPTCVLAMYCSEHCRIKAFNSYHRVECRVFRTKDVCDNMDMFDIVALRCLLVGTDQGAGLASLMKKIELDDIVDVEANIDESTEKPFSSDYMFLLRLCRKFDEPLSDKAEFIPRIIIALQKAGYFDDNNNPDLLQHKASIDPKTDGYNNSKSERDDDCNGTDKDISSKLLNSVKPAHESYDRKEDHDEGKNEDRPIVQEHAHSSTIVDTSSKNADEQVAITRELVGRMTGTPLFKNVTLGTMALDSVEAVDKSNDKKEDPDENGPQEHEDSSELVGKEFIKEVSGYYCELCNVCLCHNKEMSEDLVLLAHCSTPLHLERSSFETTEEKTTEETPLDSTSQPPESSTEITTAPPDPLPASSDANEQNVKRQDVTTQECVTGKSLLKNVTLDITVEGPPSDSTTSQPKSSTESTAPPLDSLPARSDANEQNLVERRDVTTQERVTETYVSKTAEEQRLDSTSQPESSMMMTTARRLDPSSAINDDGNEQKKFKSQTYLSTENGKKDSESGKDNKDCGEKDEEISSKALDSVEPADEFNDKKGDPDGRENKDRAQGHEDSPKIVGKEFVKEVTIYYCEQNRPQEHGDSPKLAGRKSVKTVKRHYCELCDLCLCYNPKISQDEILRAHCRTPLHLDRCWSKYSEKQDVTTDQCETETTLSKDLTTDTTTKKPQSDSTSQSEFRTLTTGAPSDPLFASDDANQQNELNHQHEIRLDPKTDEKNNSHDDSPTTVESYNKREGPDGGENENRPQEHGDSPKLAGIEFIKEVTRHYCELCNLCLCYNPEISQDEILRAHCRTPLHLDRCSAKNSEEQDVITQKYVTETSVSKTAKEPPLDSTSSQPPQSSTEVSTPPLDSLSASNDTNQQNVQTYREYVAETSLLRHLLLGKTAKKSRFDFASLPKSKSRKKIKPRLDASFASNDDANEQKKVKKCVSQPESSTLTPKAPPDSLPGGGDANEQNSMERQTHLTQKELYVSFLLLKHKLSLDNAIFPLRQLCDLENSSESTYGYGVCILHAVINHSCDPNVDLITRGQETALYALRPISKGEQIFITYTVYSFAFVSLQGRQKIMSYPFSKFQFNCECVACVNKWPMYDDLLKMHPDFLFLMKKSTVAEREALSLFIFLYSSEEEAVEALQGMTDLLGKTADSTNRLEIIQVIGRLCEYLFIEVERPYAISAECERLLIHAMKHFYDTSSPFELTEHRKKEVMLDCISNIERSLRKDLWLLPT